MPTYTAPTTRTTGELISAAIFNTDLVENIKYFKDAPAFAGNVTVGGTLTVTGAATYTTSIKSTTALATPGALSATQATAFASTVSGAAIMGFGTTNDVALMNRAGTVVLGVGPNTTAVNMVGTLSVAGLTTLSATGDHWNKGSLSLGPAQSASIGAGDLSVARSATTAYLNFGSNGLVNLALASSVLTLNGATLSVSGAGVNSFSAGSATENTVRVTNTTSGTTAYADFGLVSGSVSTILRSHSQGFTSSGPYQAGGGLLYNNGAGGWSMLADNASGAIRFYSGGTSERWRMFASGSFSYNGSSDRGSGGIDAVKVYAGSPNSGTGTNVVWNTSTGEFIRDSSSERYKTITQRNWKPTNLNAFLALSPILFDFRNGGGSDVVGFSAEESAATGLLSLVNLDTEGRPESLRVQSFMGYQHLVLQQHDATITQLAARIAALESQDN